MKLLAILPLTGAAVFLTLILTIGKRWHFHKEDCTAKTTGTVIRFVSAGENAPFVPLYEYYVDGKRYKQKLRFSNYVTRTVSTPFKNGMDIDTNLTDPNHLPDTYRRKINKNSFVSAYKEPLSEWFPVGSCTTVYYDPKDPHHSYVHRYISMNYLYYMFIAFFIPIAILGIILLVVL